jgi:hypothetical protein
MGMLRFSECIRTYEVPRLENDLIDELFYQEDEIGEMRHTAFMIECGLEEDPPDGPDVPPVPWGEMLLKANQNANGSRQTSQSSSSTEDSKPMDCISPRRKSQAERTLPERSRSTDDMDLLEEELCPPDDTRRKLVATKSGTVRPVRPQKPVKRAPPPRSHSVDDSLGMDLSLAFAKTEGSPPGRRGGRKLVAANSGSLHGMRAAAAKAAGRKDEEGVGGNDGGKIPTPRSPVRRLVAAKSGTVHGMRKAIQDQVTKSPESNGAARPPRPIAVTRSFGPRTTKPETNIRARSISPAPAKDNHIVFKNGVRTVVTSNASSSNSDLPPRSTPRRSSVTSNSASSTKNPTSPSSSSSPRGRGRIPVTTQRSGGFSSSESDDDFLAEVVGDSDGDDNSDVSISTNASDDDKPSSSPKKCFVKKGISYSPSPQGKKSISSSSDAKNPASSTTKSYVSKGKKKKSLDGKDISSSDASDSSLSPSKRTLKGTRREVRSGMTKAERNGSSEKTVEAALSRLRNGASTPSQLLQNMQSSGSPARSPRKTIGTKSGAKKFRSKSVGGLDIPPAFRGL